MLARRSSPAVYNSIVSREGWWKLHPKGYFRLPVVEANDARVHRLIGVIVGGVTDYAEMVVSIVCGISIC